MTTITLKVSIPIGGVGFAVNYEIHQLELYMDTTIGQIMEKYIPQWSIDDHYATINGSDTYLDKTKTLKDLGIVDGQHIRVHDVAK